MSHPPYPNYGPAYHTVTESGGFKRTCVVVELLSEQQLDEGELAFVKENLEFAISKIHAVEKAKVILPSAFDRLLSTGLRLPR